MARILLFGGSGTLGIELQKLDKNIIAPNRSIIDIKDSSELFTYILENKYDIIINAAADINNRNIEINPSNAILTNIIGSANLAEICLILNIRLVYISSDYIYKGNKGNYNENDEILPYNLYAWTKLGGECSVKCVENHLIIRTSFGKNIFEYNEAFTDKFTSKDYADVIAPLIYKAAISKVTGVLNIGTEKKTMFDYSIRRKTTTPIKINNNNTPTDTSLDLTKMKHENIY